ncbi:carbamoyltransferase HypF [Amycolatopsis orientalis]|uniref:carbamoyltransferase HypF n=1 Tax=Amycolatopsis orientalis TaxID=31958 RepID=UPI0003F8A583|nr:carbamoyltransferase HypF [Amycolatopsis orientalis]
MDIEAEPGRRSARIEVHGTVQGVGFRPFVHRLAVRLGLDGDVRNDAGTVVIHAAGPGGPLREFVELLRTSAPPSAKVGRIEVDESPADLPALRGFHVRESVTGRPSAPEVPPDQATCADCLRELFDPADRRYRYPFLNCTACGPRATIIENLPYDRERTAMRGFPLCPDCEAEYRDPADRRFHAEPIACPACGPRLAWHSGHTLRHGDAALAAACAVIAGGGIVALKGIGGYQLVCDATDTAVVDRLRLVKPRPSKPLAVMVPDLRTARLVSVVDDRAAELLGSPAAPIVLLPKSAGTPLAASVSPGLTEVGVFLPCTPLHHLLLAELARPLVVTSGNRAGTPIITDDATARAELDPITDGRLDHDRPIWSRYDDSVVRVLGDRTITLRRARGYAPEPLPLPVPAPEPVLALGAQLKHTSTLALGAAAITGPHTGDLEDSGTFGAFELAAEDLCRLHGARPRFCAHDLHPGYLSTRFARRWPVSRRIAVQHHHAHVVATAAEHGVREPFVGVALDGLGLGDDGTFWGAEILLATYTGYRRVGRFATAPLPGGAAAVRRPARMALGYLFGAEPCTQDPVPEDLAKDLLGRMSGREVAVIRAMIRKGLNSPRASSAGRLFDAVSALLGLCDDNGYEGEAATRLEAAATGFTGVPPLRWKLRERDGLWVYDPNPTLRDALESALDSPVGEVAARFHRTVSEVVVALAVRAAESGGTDVVCLGGGVFQNALLTAGVLDGLAEAGLRAFAGERIPMNDGGISYGQAAIAAATMSER